MLNWTDKKLVIFILLLVIYDNYLKPKFVLSYGDSASTLLDVWFQACQLIGWSTAGATRWGEKLWYTE